MWLALPLTSFSSVKEMGINFIVFTCTYDDHEVEVEVGLKNIVDETTGKTIYAFQLLMAGGSAPKIQAE